VARVVCVIKKPRGRGDQSPRWAAEPEVMMMMMIIIIIILLAITTYRCPALPIILLVSYRSPLIITLFLCLHIILPRCIPLTAMQIRYNRLLH
jgi:hypothetical protein